jgi:hypothetical protein
MRLLDGRELRISTWRFTAWLVSWGVRDLGSGSLGGGGGGLLTIISRGISGGGDCLFIYFRVVFTSTGGLHVVALTRLASGDGDWWRGGRRWATRSDGAGRW